MSNAICYFFLLFSPFFPIPKQKQTLNAHLQLRRNAHAHRTCTNVSNVHNVAYCGCTHPHQGSTIYQMLIKSYGYFTFFYFLQVYSHDTGRVKIKISETAKPKTPILVTRAPSNAGDDKYVNQINQ